MTIDQEINEQDERGTYTVHMNVKLSKEQADAVLASGKKTSECIRDAVQRWIDARE